MSYEIEQAMKAAWDGKFHYLCGETGESRVKSVPRDYMPCFEPYGFRFSGQNNGCYRPWTAEADEKLIAARHAGMLWPVVAKSIGRGVVNTRQRYFDLCKQRGIKPLTDVRNMKVGA